MTETVATQGPPCTQPTWPEAASAVEGLVRPAFVDNVGWLGGLRRHARRILRPAFVHIPPFGDVIRTRDTNAPLTVAGVVRHKWFRRRSRPYWPVHRASVVVCVRRIRIGIGMAPGLNPACYLQGVNGIEMGDYTATGPGVGLISANHSPTDVSRHLPADPIRIGRYCWLGMNAVVLPGVQLGDHTIVGAGAVVTRSFPEGYAVLAGAPARLIRRLAPEEVVERRNEHEYIGFHRLAGRTREQILEKVGCEML